MSVRTKTQRGLENQLWTTAELAREFGLRERDTQARVASGDLIPTARTPSGFARWRREDFAAQVAPRALGVAVPRAVRYADGSTTWRGSVQVTAQPGHCIEIIAYGTHLYVLPSQATELAALLPSAIEVADHPDPACTCRELPGRYGQIEMIVPIPTCPVHEGATP